MGSETEKRNATECSGGCSCCGLGTKAGEGTVSGLKMVVCAFLVFVVPLISAAMGAGIVQHYYHGSRGWTIGSALIAALAAALVVRPITRYISGSERPHCPTAAERTLSE